MKYLQRLLARAKQQRRDGGATAVEYVLLIVFVAIAITAGATALAGALNGAMDNAGNTVLEGGGGSVNPDDEPGDEEPGDEEPEE